MPMIPVETTNFNDELNDACYAVLEENVVTTTQDGGELGIQTIEIGFPQLDQGVVRAYPKAKMPALCVSARHIDKEAVAAGTIGHNHEIDLFAIVQSGDLRAGKEACIKAINAAAAIVQAHIRGDTGQFLASQHQVWNEEDPRFEEPEIDGYTVTAQAVVKVQVLQSVPVLGGIDG